MLKPPRPSSAFESYLYGRVWGLQTLCDKIISDLYKSPASRVEIIDYFENIATNLQFGPIGQAAPSEEFNSGFHAVFNELVQLIHDQPP